MSVSLCYMNYDLPLPWSLASDSWLFYIYCDGNVFGLDGWRSTTRALQYSYLLFTTTHGVVGARLGTYT